MKKLPFILCFLFLHPLILVCLFGADVLFEPSIRLDQFGYLPESPKVAIISEPVEGFNAPGNYLPGEIFEVREWFTENTVYADSLVAWKNGAIHTQSGDKGKWFDFSPVKVPGTYYLYDIDNDVASYPFVIADDVYNGVLKTALRTFFIQRLSFDKLAPYIDEKWSDTASYDYSGQDREARSRWAKDDAATARDVHGGWMDAGDPNKYTTFAEYVVIDLLDAYEANPRVFTDLYGIPESGNGIPDILDEIKYEMDWLCRMQDATGTGGLLLKVGVDNHEASQPLSTDMRPRYYVPECTSSTLAGANMFARCALLFRTIPHYQAYAAELEIRAMEAWERGKINTQNFTVFESECDDQDVTSGDADRQASDQLSSAVIAATFLYRLTGKVDYRDFVETQYQKVKPISQFWWGPYAVGPGRAFLAYAQYLEIEANNTGEGEDTGSVLATGIDLVNLIREQKSNMNYVYSINDSISEKDLYRAHMEDSAYHWGSNIVRSQAGNLNLDFIQYSINPEDALIYHNIANEYLHWLHGANPLGKVMLSNMAAWGAENSVNEFYHTWFADGSDWDSVLTSIYGPAPGFLVGGPNKSYTGTSLIPPANQPPQKSYKDFNSGFPENSWEITENAIYYQSAYILLLSRIMPGSSVEKFHDPLFEPTFNLMESATPGVVDLMSLSSGEYTLRVLNLSGSQLHAQTMIVQSNRASFLFPELEPGVYFIEMSQGDQAALRKWVVSSLHEVAFK